MTCLCSFLKVVPTPHRVVILQHPRETRSPLNTVPILRQVVPHVDVRCGVDFSSDEVVAQALSDTSRSPTLLFPGPGSRLLSSDGRVLPYTLVLIDGTWRQARSILRKNARLLAAMPQYRVEPREPGIYTLRSQPKPGYLSTLEAAAEALTILHADPDIRNTMLLPLRAFVGLWLACADGGTAAVLRDRSLLARYRYLPEIPADFARTGAVVPKVPA